MFQINPISYPKIQSNWDFTFEKKMKKTSNYSPPPPTKRFLDYSPGCGCGTPLYCWWVGMYPLHTQLYRPLHTFSATM